MLSFLGKLITLELNRRTKQQWFRPRCRIYRAYSLNSETIGQASFRAPDQGDEHAHHLIVIVIF